MLGLVAQKAQPWLLQPLPMGAPGGVGAQEPVGGHGGAGDGWAVERDRGWMGSAEGAAAAGALVLPGDTCTWGMFAEFSAGV